MQLLPGEEPDLYTLLNEGLALYHAERPFEAHEIWEYGWNSEVGRSKLALQALIQIAAALYKDQTKSPRGASKLFAKARDKLAEVREGASAWLGIDLVRLAADVDRALAAADRIAQSAGTAESAGSESVEPPYLPRVVGRDGILYLHGFASGPTSHKASLIVPALARRGFHVAVPDLNQGDFYNLTITRALALARRQVRERTLVIGSSLGGYIATLLASKDERVVGLVLMAPAFAMAERLRERYGDSGIAAWRQAGGVDVEHYAWRGKHPIGYGFYEDASKHPARPAIRVPTYILQGRRDDVVSPALAREIAERHPQMIELEMTDDEHALGGSSDHATRAIDRMIERLKLQPEPAPAVATEVLARRFGTATP